MTHNKTQKKHFGNCPKITVITTTSNSQKDFINFIKDPENIKKAVEGSMDKRNKVFNDQDKGDFTDEQYLHQYFHYYLKTMYKDSGKDEPKYWFMDGFEEPLDPDYLCEAIYSLANRLGYKLVNNMWEDL